MADTKSSIVRAELTRIYQQRGELTRSVTVEEARDPSSPIHSDFEWDDTIAGHKYRLEQAGALIRSVKIEYVPAPDGTSGPYDRRDRRIECRAFVSVERADGPPSYEPVEIVARDESKKAIVLRAMEREWRQMKATYGHLEEFFALVEQDAATMRGAARVPERQAAHEVAAQ